MGRQTKAFNEFVGQRRVITYLRRLILGAKTRGLPCPHLLFIARSGAGKTELAKAVAREFGSKLHSLFGGKDVRPADICAELATARHGDVFFVDEAHSLDRDAQQILFKAIDELKVPALKEGRLDHHHFESIAAFTLILATNEPGRLKPALRQRLTMLEFAPYTLRELLAIARRTARKEGVELTAQAARRLAEVAQASPRRVHQRIQTLRFFWPHVQQFHQGYVDRLLRREGIDPHGLTTIQRQYLLAIAASPRGTCSLGGLAARLGVDTGYIRDEVEIYLIDSKWIEIGSGSGRKLTKDGWALAEELVIVENERPQEVKP